MGSGEETRCRFAAFALGFFEGPRFLGSLASAVQSG